MQVKFIMYLYTRGYNSLSDPTTSLKEKHVLKYKLIRNLKHQPCIHPPISWFYFYFLHLQIIESIFWHRKIISNYLLESENSENWCMQYAGHSVDIISTCYAYENKRKWLYTKSREWCRQVWNSILFKTKKIIWRFTLTNYWKHFPQSICREFMSPVGYFYLYSITPL